MDALRNPLLMSVPFGRWLGMKVRLSVLLLLVAVALLMRYPEDRVAPETGEAAGSSAALGDEAAPDSPPAADGLDGESDVSVEQAEPPRARPTEDEVTIEAAASDVPAAATNTPVENVATQPSLPRVEAVVDDPLTTAAIETVDEPAATSETPFQGLALASLLILTALAQQIAEAFVMERQGGRVDTVVVWPAGGTVVGSPPRAFLSEMATAAVGPSFHFAVCVLLAPVVILTGATAAFHPFRLPDTSEVSAIASLGIMAFTLNWKLLLISLLPLHPLSGGRMIQIWRADTRGRRQSTAMKWALWSLFAGLLLLAAWGPAFDNSWLTLLGGILLTVNAIELVQLASPEPEEDTPFGYDFSQGYTSLEGDDEFDDEDEREPVLSPWSKWKQDRDDRRRQREEAERAQAESELDRLLEKISRVGGVDKLTIEEQRTLKRLSARFKT